MGCSVSGQIIPSNAEYQLTNKGSGIPSENRMKMPRNRAEIRLPLTEKEVFTLTKSWKPIAQNMVNTGVNMFLRFVTKFLMILSLQIYS